MMMMTMIAMTLTVQYMTTTTNMLLMATKMKTTHMMIMGMTTLTTMGMPYSDNSNCDNDDTI